jgi:hypothetical protein
MIGCGRSLLAETSALRHVFCYCDLIAKSGTLLHDEQIETLQSIGEDDNHRFVENYELFRKIDGGSSSCDFRSQ